MKRKVYGIYTNDLRWKKIIDIEMFKIKHHIKELMIINTVNFSKNAKHFHLSK